MLRYHQFLSTFRIFLAFQIFLLERRNLVLGVGQAGNALTQAFEVCSFNAFQFHFGFFFSSFLVAEFEAF
jgi:hypothetical protein